MYYELGLLFRNMCLPICFTQHDMNLNRHDLIPTSFSVCPLQVSIHDLSVLSQGGCSSQSHCACSADGSPHGNQRKTLPPVGEATLSKHNAQRSRAARYIVALRLNLVNPWTMATLPSPHHKRIGVSQVRSTAHVPGSRGSILTKTNRTNTWKVIYNVTQQKSRNFVINLFHTT